MNRYRPRGVLWCALMLSAFLMGCGESDRRLGADTYRCPCDCTSTWGYATVEATTCADDHAQAVTNCQTDAGDCARAVARTKLGKWVWDCRVINSDEVHMSDRDFCELTGESSDSGWTSESLTSESTSMPASLIASRSPTATFVGTVDTGDSWLRLENTEDGSETTVPVSGELSFTGGDCPGDTCNIEMEYGYFYTAPFDIGSHRVADLKLINNGIWAGSKDTDGQFTFDSTRASLNIAGNVDDNFTSLTASASDRGVTGELVGIEVLNVTLDGSSAPLSIGMTGNIEFFYPTFFFQGTFRQDNIIAELRITVGLLEGAPYAKAEQYYDDDQLVLDGSKSSHYKCLWGYCEQREGVTSIEIPGGSPVEGTNTVGVESRWADLEILWLDANDNVIGDRRVIYPEETPAYPVTLIVKSESDGVIRMDLDILERAPIRVVGHALWSSPFFYIPFFLIVVSLVFIFLVRRWRLARKPAHGTLDADNV